MVNFRDWQKYLSVRREKLSVSEFRKELNFYARQDHIRVSDSRCNSHTHKKANLCFRKLFQWPRSKKMHSRAIDSSLAYREGEAFPCFSGLSLNEKLLGNIWSNLAKMVETLYNAGNYFL